MSRPKLLDLFCCEGGAAMGYSRAGFDVYGVDNDPAVAKRYPFPIHIGDALDVLRRLINGEAIDFRHRDGTVEWLTLSDFAAIHASPPCQLYSASTIELRASGKVYPDLLPPTRETLLQQSLPWVIENVPGAPMRADIKLCGCYFDLGVMSHGRWLGLRRERWFETSWEHFQMMPPHTHGSDYITVVGHGTPSWSREKLGFNPTMREKREAMDIHWTERGALSEAIPPAYTEFIGAQLLATLAPVRGEAQ